MSRLLRRVPLNSDWPMGEVWSGFLLHDDEGNLVPTVEPPTGDGWQMWEDVSAGSPISPVFATAEELATWLAEHREVDGNYEQWMAMIRMGWAPSFMILGGRPPTILTGVQAADLPPRREQLEGKGEGGGHEIKG